MAFIPFLVNDFVNECFERGPCDSIGQFCNPKFVRDLLGEEAWSKIDSARRQHSKKGSDSRETTISNEKNQFKINLDVQHFSPEEINVKLIGDYVVIEGKHEEKEDEYGLISRQFTRKFKIPENIQADRITSSISSDAILSIVAPRKPEPQPSTSERQIPIIRTGEPSPKEDSNSTNNANKMES